MPLFARNYEDLMASSLNDLAQNTNLTRLTPGGIARSILESSNKRTEEAFETFDLNIARAFVSSASGQFLELIGILLGVNRNSAIAASASSDTEAIRFYVSSGTFGDINNGNAIPITQGSLISTEPNNGGTVYRVIESIQLLPGLSSQWISAEAVLPGEESNVGTNALIYHDVTAYSDSENESLLVNNVHPVANGVAFESDANYRFRIVNRVLEAEAANLTAIRLAVLITPGVADVVLIPRYRGIGTFGAIIKATLPTVSQSLIDDVTANVSKVQSLGSISFIKGPKETGITMKTTIHYAQRLPDEELESIEDTLVETITDFINSLDIGEEFFLNRMVSEFFAVDDRISNVGTAGIPIEEIYIHKDSKLGDNRVRQSLLGDYSPESDERVIIEPTVETPITLDRSFVRR